MNQYFCGHGDVSPEEPHGPGHTWVNVLWQWSRHGGIIRPRGLSQFVRMRGAPGWCQNSVHQTLACWNPRMGEWNYLSLLMRKKAYYLCRSQGACIIFKAGKSHDGYFDCVDLYSQTEWAIKLFEDNFPGTAVAVFGFDNAPDTRKELRMHSQLKHALETWGATRFLSCIQWSHNSWSIQRNEGYPRGMRLPRGSQFTSWVSGLQMPRPES